MYIIWNSNAIERRTSIVNEMIRSATIEHIKKRYWDSYNMADFVIWLVKWNKVDTLVVNGHEVEKWIIDIVKSKSWTSIYINSLLTHGLVLYNDLANEYRFEKRTQKEWVTMWEWEKEILSLLRKSYYA